MGDIMVCSRETNSGCTYLIAGRRASAQKTPLLLNGVVNPERLPPGEPTRRCCLPPPPSYCASTTPRWCHSWGEAMIKILSLHHAAARPRLRCEPDAPRPSIHLAVSPALAADGLPRRSR